MKKQLMTLALAGMVAIPFVAGHSASAQTSDNQAKDSKAHVIHVNYQTLEELKEKYSNWMTQFINKYQLDVTSGHQQHDQHVADKGNSAPSTNQNTTGTTDETTSTTESVSAYEKEVVTLTNKERTKRGLKPLTLDTELSKMARDKSKDMVANHYFDHQSPTYGSPFDMMKRYGISYSYAGENIAAGQKTPEDVVEAWMNSEGHRENILNPNFTKIGVGYVQGGSYGSYWTQEFIGQ